MADLTASSLSALLEAQAAAAGRDDRMESLRVQALRLADGNDWSRCDDHQVIAQVTAALSDGRLAAPGALAAVELHRIAIPPPAAAPSAPPASSAPRAAAAAPPPADPDFASNLDVAAMVAVLQQAARNGDAFCEECARAAAEAT